MTDNNKGLGWRPDLPDVRDEKYTFRTALRHELKSEISLPVRTLVPWHYCKTHDKPISELHVYDQGSTSSCTGQSTGNMIDQMSGWTPRSRLELYWWGRVALGETDKDDGAYIRDVIKGAADKGAGSDSLWPFLPWKLHDEPSEAEMYSASRHKVSSYHRLQTRQDFQSCLAQGYAFVIGFTCYDDFVTSGSYVDKTGVLNYPTSGSTQGGHAVCVIGYDDDFGNSEWGKKAASQGVSVPSKVYIVRNSWGVDWGNKGNFAVDAAYFENPNLADDAWTVRIGKNSS